MDEMNRRNVANPGVLDKRKSDSICSVILVVGSGKYRIKADVLDTTIVDPSGSILGDIAAAVIARDRLDKRHINRDGVTADRCDLSFITDHIPRRCPSKLRHIQGINPCLIRRANDEDFVADSITTRGGNTETSCAGSNIGGSN